MATNRIDFTIAAKADTASWNQAANVAKNSFKKINEQISQIMRTGTDAQKQQLAQAAKEVKKFGQIFDNSLMGNGKIDFAALNAQMKSSGMSLEQISRAASTAGGASADAFNRSRAALLSQNKEIKEGNKLLDSMFATASKTFKWGMSNMVFHELVDSVAQAFNYIEKLDKSLNNIRIVTNKSAEDMAEFAVQANKAASALGRSTTDYTNASLIYYQQGLKDRDVQQMTDVTLKTANITGQSTIQVSEELTALKNAYKLGTDEVEGEVDKMAAVAASSASSLEELTTAMQKVASTANSTGVTVDQLTAQISTIESVTRQDAASIGTALKTIYARIGDLKVDGVDEFGTTLGTVSGTMRQMGIEVTDEMGNMRDMGSIIEDTAQKWQTWTNAQKQAAAVAMAGKRQYNNLYALFENYEQYTKMLETAGNAEGTVQRQNAIHLESLEAHLQKVQTAKEAIFDDLLKADDIKGLVDSFEQLLQVVDRFIKALGGGKTALAGIGAMVTAVFSNQITNLIDKKQFEKGQREAEKAQAKFQKDLLNTSIASGGSAKEVAINKELNKFYQQREKYSRILNEEQSKYLINLGKEKAELEGIVAAHEQIKKDALANHSNLLSAEDFTDEDKKIEKLDQLDNAATNIKQRINTRNRVQSALDIYERQFGIEEIRAGKGKDGSPISKTARGKIENDEGIFQSGFFNQFSLDGDQRKEFAKRVEDLRKKSKDGSIDADEFNKQYEQIITDLRTQIGKARKAILDEEIKKTEELLAKMKDSVNKGDYLSEDVQAQEQLLEDLQNLRNLDYTQNNLGNRREDLRNAQNEDEKRQQNVTDANEALISHDEGSTEAEQAKKRAELLEKQNKAYMDGVKKAAKYGNAIKALSSSVSGLSFGLMGLNSVTTIWEDWQDKSISGTEALTQTIMSLSMALPGLRASLKSLSNAFGIDSIAKGFVGAKKTSEQLMTNINEGLAKNNGNIWKQIFDEDELKDFLNSGSIDEITSDLTDKMSASLQEKAKGFIEKLTNLGAKKNEDGTFDLSDVSDEATAEEAIANLDEVQEAMQNVGNAAEQSEMASTSLLGKITSLGVAGGVLLGVVAAVGVTLTALKIYDDYQKKQRESQIKANEQQMEKTQQTIDESNAVIDATSSYRELYKEYEKTGKVSGDLVQASEQLIETLGKENESILALKSNYQALSMAAEEAEKKALEEKEAAATHQMNLSTSNLELKEQENSPTMTETVLDNVLEGAIAYLTAGNLVASSLTLGSSSSIGDAWDNIGSSLSFFSHSEKRDLDRIEDRMAMAGVERDNIALIGGEAGITVGDEDTKAAKALQKAFENHEITATVDWDSGAVGYEVGDTAAEQLATLDSLNEFLSDPNVDIESEAFKAASEAQQNLAEEEEKLRQAVVEAKDAIVQNAVTKSGVNLIASSSSDPTIEKNYDRLYKTIESQFKKDAKGAYTTAEVRTATYQQMIENGDEYTKKWAEIQLQIEQLGQTQAKQYEEYAKDRKDDFFETDKSGNVVGWNEDKNKRVQAFTDFLKDRGFEGQFNLGDMLKSGTLSKEDFENMLGLKPDSPEFEAAVNDIFDKSFDYMSEKWRDSVNTLYSSSSDLLANALSGNLQAGDASLATFRSLVEGMQSYLPQFQSEIEVLSNDALVGSDLFVESLERINHALADIKNNQINEELTGLFDETSIDATADELAEFYDEWGDKELEWTVNIDSQVDDFYESAKKGIEELQEGASKIEADYKVAAENVEAVGKAFPGILKDAKVYTDGTVQLDEQATQKAIKNQQKKNKEKIEGYKQDIKLQISYEKTQLKAFNRALKALQGEGKAQQKLAKAKDILEKSHNKIKEKQTKNQGQWNEELSVSAANSATAVSDNWINAYNEATQAAQKFAETAYNAGEAAKGNKDAKEKALSVTPYVKQTKTNNTSLSGISSLDIDTSAGTNDNVTEAIQEILRNKEILEANINEHETYLASLDSLSLAANSSATNAANGSPETSDRKYTVVVDKSTLDVFRVLNDKIDVLNNEISELESVANTLVGTAKAEKEQEEADKKAELSTLYRQKTNVARGQLSQDMKDLSFYGATAENGVITNYNKIYKKLEKASIRAERKSAKNEDSEKLKNAATIAKNNFENFKTIADSYKSNYSAYQDSLKNFLEAKQAQWEKQIAAWQTGFDFEREITDQKIKINDFLAEMKQDGIGDELEKAETASENFALNMKNVQSATEQVKDVQNAINRMNKGKKDEVFGLNIEKAKSSLIDATEKLQSYYKELKQDFENLTSAVEELTKSWGEAVKNVVEYYKKANDQLETTLKLTELIQGTYSTKQLQVDTYEEEIANNINSIAELKSAVADSEKQLQEVKKSVTKGMKEGTDEYIQALASSEAYQSLKQSYEDLSTELVSLGTSTIEKIIEKNKAELSILGDNLEKAILGNTTEAIETMWDTLKAESEQFFDDIERTFRENALENEFELKIDDNASAELQDKMRAAAESILEMTRAKTNLDKTDLDIARKMYQVELARIALEEAQNSKSNLRLKRDSQGNYSYMFGADMDEVADKEKEYNEAQADLYETLKSRITSNYESAMKLSSEFSSKVTDLGDKYGYGTDEFNKYLEELKDSYVNQYESLMTSTTETGELLVSQFGEEIQEMMGLTDEAFDELTLGEKVGGVLGDIDTGFLKTMNKVKAGTANIGGSFDTFVQKAKTSAEQAATAMQNIGTVVDSTTSDLSDYYEDAATSAKSLAAAIKDDLTSALDTWTKNLPTYKEAISGLSSSFDGVKTSLDNIDSASTKTEKAIQKMLKKLKKAVKQAKNYSSAISNLGGTTNGGGKDDKTTDVDNGDNKDPKKPSDSKKPKTTSQPKTTPIISSKSGLTSNTSVAGIGEHSMKNTKSYNTLRAALKRHPGSVLNALADFWGFKWSKTANKYVTDQDSYAYKNNRNKKIKIALPQGTYNGDQLEMVGNTFFTDKTRKNWAGKLTLRRTDLKSFFNGAKFEGDHGLYVKSNKALYASSGSKKYGNKKYFFDSDTSNMSEGINNIDALLSKVRSHITSAKTGGYTGTWYDEGLDADKGKLAILHQKELILNASDTEKILEAVKEVRGNSIDFSKSLKEALENSYLDILSDNKLPKQDMNLTIQKNTEVGDTIEQVVNIEATFTDATTAKEITSALSNLRLQATQYAYNKENM